MLSERLAELLFEKGCEIGHVNIAHAEAYHRCFVGMHQARLLEQALKFLARGGAALV